MGVGVAALILAVLARELTLSARAGSVMRAALADRPRIDSAGRRVTSRSLLFPWPFLPRTVVRTRGLSYGPLPHQTLDVYRSRSGQDERGPVLVQLHGGGFTGGRRSKEALSLLHQLSGQGWVCVSADYRLARTPADGHPASLVDVKLLIAWLRTEGHLIGADPSTLVLVGTSAGAHLAAMAALTAGEPRYQPGFEQADTSISGFVGFAGYYGRLSDELEGTSPFDHLDSSACPPGLIVHGSRDTQTSQFEAQLLAQRIGEQSGRCAFALLPGAHHTFDLLDSVRFRGVRQATAAFCQGLLADGPDTSDSQRRTSR